MAPRRIPRWLQAARKADPLFALPPRAIPRWVERVLAQSGMLAPGEIHGAILAGRARINGSTSGRIVTDPLELIGPGETLSLDDAPVPLEPTTLVLLFHKPARTVVARREPRGLCTVFDVLLAELPRALERYEWHAVGRLDRDTTGLLLFTNDARLVSHVCRPEQHLPKRYLAEVRRIPSDDLLEPLRAGVVLQDGRCRPAEVCIRDATHIALTITEGRSHQIKRMLAAVGLSVKGLHREAVGGVSLDVPESAWRQLTLSEVRDGLRFSPAESTPGLAAAVCS
jgi:pseudouridine synthase